MQPTPKRNLIETEANGARLAMPASVTAFLAKMSGPCANPPFPATDSP